MCTFVFSVLPPGAEVERVRPALGDGPFGFFPTGYTEQFTDVEGTIFLATNRHCDCGTPLGNGRNEAARHDVAERSIEAQAERLLRKGWTEARLRRWRDEKARSLAKREARPTGWGMSREEELAAWMSLVVGAARLPSVSWVGLFRHSTWDREGTRVRGPVRVALSRLSSEMLSELEEDVLYRFVRD
jgi:hypothetical protein